MARADPAIAVRRGREVPIGSSANGLDRLVGTHGFFDSRGAIQQDFYFL